MRSLSLDDVGDDVDDGGEEEEQLGDYVLKSSRSLLRGRRENPLKIWSLSGNCVCSALVAPLYYLKRV